MEQTWDLDSIYAGGPAAAAFSDPLRAAMSRVAELCRRADALPTEPEPALFGQLLLDLEGLSPALEQLGSFAGCHASADSTSVEAQRAEALVTDLGARAARAWVVPSARLAFMSDESFRALTAEPALAHMVTMLEEKRAERRFRLPEGEDALATELARDGVLAWGQLYDVATGGLTTTVDRGRGPETLSASQTFNLFFDEDAGVRRRGFDAWTQAWQGVAPTCATILTHITGARQTLNDRRGIKPMDEWLFGARITEATLHAMMDAARAAGPMLHRYLAAKARFLGVPKLDWCDIHAPIGKGDGKIAYADAQSFVLDQFRSFSPAMERFAARAFDGRWVETEDRPGKRGGGFCTGFPLRKESRIFMTWGDSMKSVSTLAHELGHAFHAEVLFREPPARQRLPMTLAETASTFGEIIVREAAMARAKEPAVRLRLLDEELTTALAFLVNVPARVDIEQSFYRQRRDGPLDPGALSASTEAILRSWYGESVGEVDRLFWCNKLHFFIGGLAFYNFPYTFGYLFSSLVYAQLRPLGPQGEAAWERLLARTGSESAEKIAKEELGLDLEDPATWLPGVRRLEPMLADYLAATGGYPGVTESAWACYLRLCPGPDG